MSGSPNAGLLWVRYGNHHRALTLRLLETLCGDDSDKILETQTAAEEAICARIRFWDGILGAIDARRDKGGRQSNPE